jgi:hypothetical protein
MKRVGWILVAGAAFVFACGGDDDGGSGPDAGPANPGFVIPDVVTTAYLEMNDQWVEQGPADWTCLNTASSDVTSTVAITVSGTVEDFQTGNKVPDATVTVFDGVDLDNPHDTTTTDQDGNYSLTMPAGRKRVGYKITTEGTTLPTYQLNYYYEPDTAAQTEDINSVSKLTADALPAFIGITRTPGLGVLAGSFRDCQNREVEGVIATVSSVSGSPEHVEGAQTYYFSAGSTSLPVRHSQQAYSNTDSLYVVIELPVLPQAYLQVWGFKDAADMADGEPTLLGEIAVPVRADSVLTSSLEPLRTN